MAEVLGAASHQYSAGHLSAGAVGAPGARPLNACFGGSVATSVFPTRWTSRSWRMVDWSGSHGGSRSIPIAGWLDSKT